MATLDGQWPTNTREPHPSSRAAQHGYQKERTETQSETRSTFRRASHGRQTVLRTSQEEPQREISTRVTLSSPPSVDVAR